MTTTYNGWTNHETWNVALWIGNDEVSYGYWRATAQECYDEATAKRSFTREERATLDLSEKLKDEITDGAPDIGSSCYSDLLVAALSEVNWHEIAVGMIEETNKDEPEEDEADDE